MTNVEIIREIGDKYSWNHTNGFFQDLAYEKYNRYITSQQIQMVAGKRKDRRWLNHETVLQRAKEFLRVCDFDYDLARRVLMNEFKKNNV